MTYALELDLGGDPGEVGYRLQRLEVLNWGTFDSQVWTLTADGGTTLLTGDIGSGKSTLVDAITTLLVPPGKVTYNKAAGAEHRERTLKSYVMGHFKTERADDTRAAKAVGLRDQRSYSVLLAVFANAALAHSVSLAQVFWHREGGEAVQKMFVVADGELSIAADFSNFGSAVSDLRRRLRTTGAAIHDSYPPYAKEFRRRMGIDNPQAMELFGQTVSMKSVGNLTEFVRSHMLEPFDADSRITDLIDHFNDLMRAHEAVVKAKRQVEQLEPIVRELDLHDEQTAQLREAVTVRDGLPRYVAGRKVELLDARMAATAAERVVVEAEEKRLVAREDALRDEEADLRDAINRQGGDRLAGLERERAHAAELRDAQRHRRGDYEGVCADAGWAPADDASALAHQVTAAAAEVESIEQRRVEVGNEQTERQVDRRDLGKELAAVRDELQSLSERDTNIDARMVALRADIAAGCGVPERDLPFVGELLRVNDDAWRGAAERVLRGFGLSMLVPDDFYQAVSDWVDANHLRGRLVYYRVRGVPTAPTVVEERSLVWKLDVKEDSPFAEWVSATLAKRFDILCAATAEEFRYADDAVTKRGQIKRGRERHEKDDRSAIDDRRRWVLGWDNADKRRHLKGVQEGLVARVREIDAQVTRASQQLRDLERRRDTLRELRRFTDFAELDWQATVRDIERMDSEIAALRDASDVLRELNEQLGRVRNDVASTRAEIEKIRQQGARLLARHEDDGNARERLVLRFPELGDGAAEDRPGGSAVDGGSWAAAAVGGAAAKAPAAATAPAPATATPPSTVVAERVAAYLSDFADGHGLPEVPEEWDDLRDRATDDLNRRVGRHEERLRRLTTQVGRKMGDFRADWPLDTQELDSSPEGGHEYRALLDQLRRDDLPRFERKFKEMLNENAIRDVASLQSMLAEAQKQIRRRVEIINESLAEIDYQPHTYIKLEAEGTTDADIRDFRNELRSCTENTLGAAATDEQTYSEQKFLQVKAIVSRLKGREGHAEEDRRWRAKVTDVRTWFTFAASERVRADDSEHEHYSDSGGKSGGQKEKLAYTILAASLAYQFGLASQATQSKTFRFVVIDEAFGRGSDDSARFGLRLFARLGLQLLVVTPLQKIHVIEPFVTRVGFVHNDGGKTSRLATLTIEEYREGVRTRRTDQLARR
ncbi:MAG: AAA family ATPase [Actinobacteria bacterium]|nr:AAA family ATPase [Actinomycetota bacterium]